MLRKLAFAAGYSLFGLLTYFLFLYLTFPSDVARERLIYEANKAGVRLQLVDFKPAWPAGVTLKGVDIYGTVDETASKRKRPKTRVGGAAGVGGPGSPGGPGGPPAAPEDIEVPPVPDAAAEAAAGAAPAEAPKNEVPILTLDRVTLSSLLPLVVPSFGSGSPMSFEADLYGGSAEGSYGQADGFTKIVLALNGLDFARYPAVGESYDLKLGGKLNLNTDLSLHKEKIRDSTGSLTLKLDSLAVHKGSKVKGFDIPVELAFKPTEGSMDVKNGRAELKEMTLESAPVTLKISGTITLNQMFSRSRVNLKVAMKFGDELKLVTAFLPENAKSDDGFYHYILSGPFNNLRSRPDRLAARRRGGSRTTTPSAVDAAPSEPGLVSERPPIPGLPGPLSGMGQDGGAGGPGIRPPILDDAERERLREERRQRAEERRRRREELRQQRLGAGVGEEVGLPPPGPRSPVGLEQEINQEERPQRRFRGNEEPEAMPIEPEPLEPPPDAEPQPWEENQ